MFYLHSSSVHELFRLFSHLLELRDVTGGKVDVVDICLGWIGSMVVRYIGVKPANPLVDALCEAIHTERAALNDAFQSLNGCRDSSCTFHLEC